VKSAREQNYYAAVDNHQVIDKLFDQTNDYLLLLTYFHSNRVGFIHLPFARSYAYAVVFVWLSRIKADIHVLSYLLQVIIDRHL